MFAVAPISVSPPCTSFPGSRSPSRESRSLSRESAVVDSVVMRFPLKQAKLGSGSPKAVFFGPTKCLCNPLSLSSNKLMELSALSLNKMELSALSPYKLMELSALSSPPSPNRLTPLSALSPSKDSDASSDSDWPNFDLETDFDFEKEYNKAFNYDLGKESDFTISLPWEEVSIFIQRLFKDTDNGTVKMKITVTTDDGRERVVVKRFPKRPKPPCAEDGSRDCQGAFNLASEVELLLGFKEHKTVKVEIKVMSRESQLCVLTGTSTFCSGSNSNAESPT